MVKVRVRVRSRVRVRFKIGVMFMIRLRRNSSERNHRYPFYVLVKNYIFFYQMAPTISHVALNRPTN